MKRSICAAAIVLFAVNVSYAGETALDSLRASVSPSVLSELVIPGVPKGYVAGDYPSAGAPAHDIEWVTLYGGRFTMGTDNGEDNARPIHEVSIRTFDMAKTAVTVEQYAECVIKGRCTEPRTSDPYSATDNCNWGRPGRQNHPVNCVDWDQANQYARFKGARLPSESEWEYAATSGGRNQKYPWGNEEATPYRAVMNSFDGRIGGTMPVCSKPAGNSAQGLCDMAGNVSQWVQDSYQESYAGTPAPVDGSAFEGAGNSRVSRGGSFFWGARGLRADYRHFGAASSRDDTFGFRLARSRY